MPRAGPDSAPRPSCASRNVRDPGRRADLHLHSTASDGLLSPAEVAQRAASAGLYAAALMDHDTMGGAREFLDGAARSGMQALCGAEIAAVLSGDEVHLLCYFLSPPDGDLAALLAELSQGRRARAEEMLRRVRTLGYAVDAQSVLRNPQIGRPHIARELIRLGAADSVTDAFERYLGSGGPIYVERVRPQAAEVIRMVNAAGGVVSLGHPCRYRHDHLAELAQLGLGAVEVEHPSAGPDDRARLRRAALQLRLLCTGGSDYHGHNPGEEIASAACPARDAEELMRKLEKSS